jgi:hypothetical protein
VKNKNITVK